jgi:hypothetical protein
MQERFTPGLGLLDSLDRAWRTVIGNVWPFIGFMALYAIGVATINAIPFLNVVFSILFSFVFLVSLYCGFEAADRKMDGELRVSDFFNWSPRTSKLIRASLLQFAVAMLIVIPIGILAVAAIGVSVFRTGQFDGFRSIGGGTVVILALLCISVGFLYMILSFGYFYCVYFLRLSSSQALRQSWNLGKQNIGSLLLFLLLGLGIAILGTLALLIGLLVAIPVIAGTQYYFLQSMFPQDSNADWDFMANAPRNDAEGRY